MLQHSGMPQGSWNWYLWRHSDRHLQHSAHSSLKYVRIKEIIVDSDSR